MTQSADADRATPAPRPGIGAAIAAAEAKARTLAAAQPRRRACSGQLPRTVLRSGLRFRDHPAFAFPARAPQLLGAFESAGAVPARCGGPGCTPPGRPTGSTRTAPHRLVLRRGDAARAWCWRRPCPMPSGGGLAFAAAYVRSRSVAACYCAWAMERENPGGGRNMRADGGVVLRLGAVLVWRSAGGGRQPADRAVAGRTGDRILRARWRFSGCRGWAARTCRDWDHFGQPHGRTLRAVHHHRAGRRHDHHRRDLCRGDMAAGPGSRAPHRLPRLGAMWWLYFDIGAKRGPAPYRAAPCPRPDRAASLHLSAHADRAGTSCSRSATKLVLAASARTGTSRIRCGAGRRGTAVHRRAWPVQADFERQIRGSRLRTSMASP